MVMKKGLGSVIEDERRKVQREIEERTTSYVPIPEGFDPLDATAEELVAFRLPPRPFDETLLPLWRASLALPVKFVAPNLDFGSTVAMYQFNAVPADGGDGSVGGSTVGVGGRFGSSRNWSGGVVLSRLAFRFVQIVAEWNVPKVNPGHGLGPFVCSTWIGLDGYRGWMTSMPQMGTTQISGDTGAVDENGNPLPPQHAWCQWWLKGRQTLQIPVILGGVPILPAHRVVCWVTLLPPDNPSPGDLNWVLFYIRNMTTSVATQLAMAPPMNGSGQPVPARGGSAQWILERPTAVVDSPNGNVAANDLYPLPQFGEALGENISTTLPGAATDFRTCRRIRMIGRLRNPDRVEVLTLASKKSNTSILVSQK